MGATERKSVIGKVGTSWEHFTVCTQKVYLRQPVDQYRDPEPEDKPSFSSLHGWLNFLYIYTIPPQIREAH